MQRPFYLKIKLIFIFTTTIYVVECFLSDPVLLSSVMI